MMIAFLTVRHRAASWRVLVRFSCPPFDDWKLAALNGSDVEVRWLLSAEKVGDIQPRMGRNGADVRIYRLAHDPDKSSNWRYCVHVLLSY
jgi:hypothetical protein